MTCTVRRLTPDDYEMVRTVRLRALSQEPSAFGSTFEREVEFPEEEWRHRLRPEGFAHFGSFGEAGEPLGLVVGAPDDADPFVANLYAMWVEPTGRGTGVADLLVFEVVKWAVARGCATVQLLVTEGNDRAEGMYRRNGFRRTGRSQLRDRDGAREIEMARTL